VGKIAQKADIIALAGKHSNKIHYSIKKNTVIFNKVVSIRLLLLNHHYYIRRVKLWLFFIKVLQRMYVEGICIPATNLC